MYYNLHEITTTEPFKATNYKLFYINIDKGNDRDNRFQANIKKMVKYHVERFEGTNVKKMKNQEYLHYFTNKAISDVRRGYKVRDEDLSFGGMGCALSHIRLWKKLVEDTNTDHFIIFEDDIVVNDSFIDTMIGTYQTIKKTLDSDIDLLTFTQINRRNEDKIATSIPGVYKRDHFWGLCAYIINKKCAEKLLKNIFPLKEQIDSYISYQIHRKKLNVYSSDLNLEMDYTVALDSQIQTKCVECNDGIFLGLFDWTLPINVIIIAILLYYSFRYMKNKRISM
jgi:GR25 family glycosyltransferase involved in LPS biosynthesis